jgi:hypothetical protein
MPEPDAEHGRFAPTTSGPAHPGTLLAALLAWLDARSLGGRFSLRLEDIDPERCRPEHADEMLAALAWLGLDWDAVSRQSDHQTRFEAALDRLAEEGLLYAWACSRADVQRAGLRAVDGSWRYRGPAASGAPRPAGVKQKGRCACAWPGPRSAARRGARPGAGSQSGASATRCCAGATLGSRSSGWWLDDGLKRPRARGARPRPRPRTAVQVVLQRALAVAAPTPSQPAPTCCRARAARRQAKRYGAVGWRAAARALQRRRSVGWLATGPAWARRPRRPRELLAGFTWERVCAEDAVVRWTGRR